MKKLLIVTALFSFIMMLPVKAVQDEKKEIKREKFDPSRNPEADLKAAVEKASGTEKSILLDVGGEWCIWCHRMDEFIEINTEIKKYIEENYIVVKVNYSPENKNEEFLKKYPAVKGYPHIFILDKNGKFVHSQNTGELESGKGYDKDKFLKFLKKWRGKTN